MKIHLILVTVLILSVPFQALDDEQFALLLTDLKSYIKSNKITGLTANVDLMALEYDDSIKPINQLFDSLIFIKTYNGLVSVDNTRIIFLGNYIFETESMITQNESSKIQSLKKFNPISESIVTIYLQKNRSLLDIETTENLPLYSQMFASGNYYNGDFFVEMTDFELEDYGSYGVSLKFGSPIMDSTMTSEIHSIETGLIKCKVGPPKKQTSEIVYIAVTVEEKYDFLLSDQSLFVNNEAEIQNFSDQEKKINTIYLVQFIGTLLKQFNIYQENGVYHGNVGLRSIGVKIIDGIPQPRITNFNYGQVFEEPDVSSEVSDDQETERSNDSLQSKSSQNSFTGDEDEDDILSQTVKYDEVDFRPHWISFQVKIRAKVKSGVEKPPLRYSSNNLEDSYAFLLLVSKLVEIHASQIDISGSVLDVALTLIKQAYSHGMDPQSIILFNKADLKNFTELKKICHQIQKSNYQNFESVSTYLENANKYFFLTKKSFDAAIQKANSEGRVRLIRI